VADVVDLDDVRVRELGERAALADAREAISLIRSSLSEAASAARGAGGFQGAMRQEQIEARLSSAKAKLGLR
jgi:hypothetical protein